MTLASVVSLHQEESIDYERPVLIDPGIYDAVLVNWKVNYSGYFRKHVLLMHFRIVEMGKFYGVVLPAWFNVKHPKSKTTIKAGWRSDFLRMYQECFNIELKRRQINDIVKSDQHQYICTTQHTSTATINLTNFTLYVQGGLVAAQAGKSGQFLSTDGTNTTWVDIVEAAPGALDTLNELAAALGDDHNFSTTIISTTVTGLQYLVTDNISWQTTYYWRVKPLQSDWIATYTFTTYIRIMFSHFNPIIYRVSNLIV